MSHANAALTPRQRLRVARLIIDQGWPVSRAPELFNCSWPTAKRWAERYAAMGEPGMTDRSSSPHRVANRTPQQLVRKVVHLRWKQRPGPVAIGAKLEMTASTVLLDKSAAPTLWKPAPRRQHAALPGQTAMPVDDRGIQLPAPKTYRHHAARIMPRARPSSGTAGYRYLGTRKRKSPAQQSERVRKLLSYYRQSIRCKSSSVRDASAHLNQQIAQALTDGLTIKVVAESTRISRFEVRRIGLSFPDLHPTASSRQEHLEILSALSAELATLERSKAAVEGKQLRLLAAARRKRLLDDYELAAVSGLNPENIRKMTWGVEARSALPA
jgi:hypothetical protein